MKRTVVVAGVGPGLGASLARRFAAEGGQVAMLARAQDYLQRLTNENAGDQLLPIPTDLTEPNEIAEAFAKVRKDFGPVDVLIYHASASAWSGIEELTAEQLEHAWRVTVLGAFLCCKQVVAEMSARGRGAILFTGATSAIRGRAGALDFLPQSLACAVLPIRSRGSFGRRAFTSRTS